MSVLKPISLLRVRNIRKESVVCESSHDGEVEDVTGLASVSEDLNSQAVDQILAHTAAPYSPAEDGPDSVAAFTATHICEACGDKYFFASSLDFHLKRRSVEIIHHCRVCSSDLTFYNRCALLTHLRGHNVDVSKPTLLTLDLRFGPLPTTMAAQESDPPDATEVLNSTPHSKALDPRDPCVTCKTHVTTSMQEHYQGNNSLVLQCNMCDLFLPTNCSLQAHKRTHTLDGPFICPDCVLEFADRATFIAHLADCMHQYKVIQYKCKRCQISFATASMLHLHLLKDHVKVSPFWCSNCPKLNIRAKYLVNGSKENQDASPQVTSHSTHPEVCEICNKRIPSGRVVSHITQHSTDFSAKFSAYKCPTCPYACEDKVLLKTHINTCLRDLRGKSNSTLPIPDKIHQSIAAADNSHSVVFETALDPPSKTNRNNSNRLSRVADVSGMPLTPSPEPDSEVSQCSVASFPGTARDLPTLCGPTLLKDGASRNSKQVLEVTLNPLNSNLVSATDKVECPTGLIQVQISPKQQLVPEVKIAKLNNVCLLNRKQFVQYNPQVYNSSSSQVIVGHRIVLKSPEKRGIFCKNNSPENSTVKKTTLVQVSSNTRNVCEPNVVGHSNANDSLHSELPMIIKRQNTITIKRSPSVAAAQTLVNRPNVSIIAKRNMEVKQSQSTNSTFHVASVHQSNKGRSNLGGDPRSEVSRVFVDTKPKQSATLSLPSKDLHQVKVSVKEEPDEVASLSESMEASTTRKRTRRKRSLDPDFVFDGFDYETDEEVLADTDSEYSGSEETIPKAKRNKFVNTKGFKRKGVLAARVEKNSSTDMKLAQLSARDPSRRKVTRKVLDCEPSTDVLKVERRGRPRKNVNGNSKSDVVKYGISKKKLKAKSKINPKTKPTMYDEELMVDLTTMGTGLIIHNSVSIPNNSYACRVPECNFSSEDKELFTVHAKTHRLTIGNSGYQCMECGVCFVILPTFTKHLFIKHKISDVDAYMKDNDCCDKELLNKGIEGNTGSKISTENIPTVLLENQCNICLLVCENSAKLATHFRTHGMAFLRMLSSSGQILGKPK